MSNIPLIHQNRIFTGAWLKQSNKVIASESTDNNNTPVIKRCLVRRRNHDRRQNSIKVLLDKRLRGMHRRKSLSTKQKTADSNDFDSTKGKHINITA